MRVGFTGKTVRLRYTAQKKSSVVFGLRSGQHTFAILDTCRQTRQEAEPLFYESLTFMVSLADLRKPSVAHYQMRLRRGLKTVHDMRKVSLRSGRTTALLDLSDKSPTT